MQTHTSVTKRLAAIAATAATCAAAGLIALPAQASATQPGELAVQLARPTKTKIGPVTGLTASATKPGAAYNVSVDWDDLTGAEAYDVSASYAGVVVAKDRVTDSKWIATMPTTAQATGIVTIRVTPVAATGRGVFKTTQLVLPDLTAPTGSYTLAMDGATATYTQNTLTDDVTPSEQIVRSIDWGMGKGWEAWSSGESVSSTYPDMGRWEPQVRLVDQAGNTRVVPLHAVVTGDNTAPTGSFTTTPQQPWANYTRVVLTQTAVDDHGVTPADKIERWVDWKDGSAPVQWTVGTALTHVYAAAGSYAPSLRLVDEAGNETLLDAPAVTVKVDATPPKVTVRVPKRKAAHVSSWKTLRGTARDPLGTGVRQVTVQVVQKRGTSWYAYRAPSKRWVRAGSTKASAMRRTRAAVAVWNQGRWSTSVARLRKGTIVVSAKATDRVGNASKQVSVRKVLTRW